MYGDTILVLIRISTNMAEGNQQDLSFSQKQRRSWRTSRKSSLATLIRTFYYMSMKNPPILPRSMVSGTMKTGT